MNTTIGVRYELLSSLGRGGMGEVFLAHDQLLRRNVAIKRIRQGDALPDDVAVERLIREARSAAIVQHPNAVSVHDLLVEGGQTYVVMEYVDAPTLADLIRNEGRLSPERVAHIGGQVADALAAAHRAGVVHRDIKPSNIMVDAAGRAKLADFGVARSTGDSGLTGTGNMIGSVAFMAPEVARGEVADRASDVYSLGATLFAAVEGHAPFATAGEQSTSVRLLVRLVSETAPACTHGGSIGRLINRMLSASPSDRPTAAQVHRALVVRTGPSAPSAVLASTSAAGQEQAAHELPDDSNETRLRGRSDEQPAVSTEDDRTRLRERVSPNAVSEPQALPATKLAKVGLLSQSAADDANPEKASVAARSESSKTVRRGTVRRGPSIMRVLVVSCIITFVLIPMLVMAWQIQSGLSPDAGSVATTNPSATAESKAGFDRSTYQPTTTIHCDGPKFKTVEVDVTGGDVTVTAKLKSTLNESQWVEVRFWTNADDTWDLGVDIWGDGSGFLFKESGDLGSIDGRFDGKNVWLQLPLSELNPKQPLRVTAELWDGAAIGYCASSPVTIR